MPEAPKYPRGLSVELLGYNAWCAYWVADDGRRWSSMATDPLNAMSNLVRALGGALNLPPPPPQAPVVDLEKKR